MALEVLTILKFSEKIEKIVNDKKISYMDAIVWYCEREEMEVEVAAKLLNSGIKAKLQIEAESLNFLPKTSKLPL